MKIAIKIINDNIYIDKKLNNRIDYTAEPYNFKIIEIDDKYEDCLNTDFEQDLTFNIEKYNSRRNNDIIENKIEELKLNLRNTDYQAIKFAEGEISDEDYQEIRTQRQTWRQEINSLQANIK